MTVVACRELAPVLGDLDGNNERIVAAIADATGHGADVLVLPELATSGYVFASVEEARRCALSVGDPRLSAWSAALRSDAVVVAGFAELGEDGALYNSAALVGRDGVRAVHRKAHLWDREKLFFTPGSQPPPVVETVHGRIAVMICYDAEFPEYTRLAALAGADLLAVPTNWPLVDRPHGERPPEVLIAQATARVNRMAVALCDRAGNERGQTWTQGTTIISCEGWIASGIGGDQVAELDVSAGRSKRLTDNADLFDDRRPELYSMGPGVRGSVTRGSGTPGALPGA